MVQPASLWLRTPAFLCDQAVVLALGVVPIIASGVSPADLVAPGDFRRNVFLLLMGIAFVYHTLLEFWSGTTIGKRLFDLQVVMDDGAPLGVSASVLRNALRLIDGLGYWSVAVAVILLRDDGKRLGDAVGGTLVIRSGDRGG